MSQYVPDDRKDLLQRFIGIKDAAQFHGHRQTRFYINPDNAFVPEPGSQLIGVKRMHWMRHGQGIHNKWREAEQNAGRRPDAKFEDKDKHFLIDPVLTEQGEAEARAARDKTANLHPELLVVSPLRRASQTAQLAFGSQWESTPKLAHELCREGFGSLNIYDMHLPRGELEAAFPGVDYSHVAKGQDGMFVAGESEAQLAQRSYEFMCWLAARGEGEIAVTCHGKFLFSVFNSVMDAEDKALQSWFRTGEVP